MKGEIGDGREERIEGGLCQATKGCKDDFRSVYTV